MDEVVRAAQRQDVHKDPLALAHPSVFVGVVRDAEVELGARGLGVVDLGASRNDPTSDLASPNHTAYKPIGACSRLHRSRFCNRFTL